MALCEPMETRQSNWTQNSGFHVDMGSLFGRGVVKMKQLENAKYEGFFDNAERTNMKQIKQDNKIEQNSETEHY